MHVVCYKHRNTFPREDECRRAQYDEYGDHGEHDAKGSVDLRNLLQTASLTRKVQGVCEPLRNIQALCHIIFQVKAR